MRSIQIIDDGSKLRKKLALSMPHLFTGIALIAIWPLEFLVAVVHRHHQFTSSTYGLGTVEHYIEMLF